MTDTESNSIETDSIATGTLSVHHGDLDQIAAIISGGQHLVVDNMEIETANGTTLRLTADDDRIEVESVD